MGYKQLLRKIARYIVFSQSQTVTKVEIAQINYGGILKDKTIVITGGGRGLGYYMAKKCISEGARVIIAGRNLSTLEQATKELGTKCQYIVFDVAKVEEYVTFFNECKTKFGATIDSFISNAGISLHEGNFQKVSVDSFDNQFNTNFRANYFLSQAFLEMKLAEKGEGNLLLISSESADQCYDIPYGMTKAAMNSLTRALSLRVYQSGIRVNAIAPGVTLSDMTKDYADVSDGNMSQNCASGRIFLPEEVAELACFLLSNASRCISGEIIHCNAGNHLKAFWEYSVR